MRPISLGALSSQASTDDKLDWCIRAVHEIARASNEDAFVVFDSYSTNAAPPITRTLNVSSPTSQNLAAVLGSLIADLKRRGVKRSG